MVELYEIEADVIETYKFGIVAESRDEAERIAEEQLAVIACAIRGVTSEMGTELPEPVLSEPIVEAHYFDRVGGIGELVA